MKRPIVTPSRTKAVQAERNFTFKKSLGQHFLVDPNILRKIVAAAAPDPSTGFLEVGPGFGALTEALAEKAGKVVAVEVDERLIPILEEQLASYSNVMLIQDDILRCDLRQLATHFADCFAWKVVANLPYYITTPILVKFLEFASSSVTMKENGSLAMSEMILMMQKEVAERLTAAPGSKAYGSLSVFAQYHAEISWVCDVPKNAFMPPPNVMSQVIRLAVRNQPPVAVSDPDWFFQVVRAAFSRRRKTLLNNLMALFPRGSKDGLAEALRRLGVQPERRAETLSLQEFAKLSEYFSGWDGKLI